jgi:hypothetical protein
MEAVGKRDPLSRAIIHIVGAVVALLYRYVRYALTYSRAPSLGAFLVSDRALLFILISAVVASIFEATGRPGTARQFACHLVGLLVASFVVG